MNYRVEFVRALLCVITCSATAVGQEKAKGNAAKNAEALRKRAELRGDIEFNGRMYKQESFKKLSTATTIDALPKVRAKQPVSIIGVPLEEQPEGWLIATKRGEEGWNQGTIVVHGPFKRELAEGELLCFFGQRSERGGKLAFEAFLVERPSSEDLGLSFQYEVQGNRVTTGSTVQEYLIVGQVANTGRIAYSFIEIEAVLLSSGDQDSWTAIVRDLQPKSRKPFSISLSSFQGAYIASVSRPKFAVYIKDFGN